MDGKHRVKNWLAFLTHAYWLNLRSAVDMNRRRG
jgi:hypothetical protein